MMQAFSQTYHSTFRQLARNPMNLLARFEDWIETTAQNRAFVKVTGDNFESRLTEEERRIVHERRALARRQAFVKTDAEAQQVAEAELKLISNKYRPELLFDDNEFFGYKDEFSVQGFFNKRRSFLATWSFEGALASEIIEGICKSYGLDQRVILISLQREQSAVAAKAPLSNRKMMRILGYGALDGKKAGDRGTDIEKYYGFTNQISNAARGYIDLAEGYKEGEYLTLNYGKKQLVPYNAPTWAYYRYTPHTHAGKISYLIGRSFFGF